MLTYWRQGRSLPYGEGVTYWALSEMVKAQAGVLETDSDEEAERKLATAVEELIPDETDAAWIASQLRPLAGLSAGDGAQSRSQQSESFAAWRKLFEAMAERHPLVLVFEDIHWADDGLLDFVDHLVEWATDVPILVVCTARPELLDRRPGWGGGKLNAATISLSPLSEIETARLLGVLLDQPVLDAETQQRLVGLAGGNPLYAEQYAQMHIERGDAGGFAVPETVQGIIAARLDLLPAEEKRLLQDASVLGKVFWLGGLVDGRRRGEAEERLHALDRKGFIQRARQASVADEAEYAFRHVLVRDVAYAQIPRASRAEKHRAAAEWISSLGRPDDHGEMLAHHYVSALELARAAGSHTGELESQARLALEAAGDRAFSLNAYAAAAAFYESALDLWPDESLERARLLFRAGRARYIAQQQDAEELLERAAALLKTLGDLETAAQSEVLLFELQLRKGWRDVADPHLVAASALVDGAPASRAKTDVLMHFALSNMLASRAREAITYGRQTFELAEQLGLDEFRAAALNIVGVARAGLGDRDGVKDIERAIEIAKAANSPYEVARAYNNLASTHWAWGDMSEAQSATAECIRVCDQFGQSVWRRWQRPFEAWHAYSAGDWDSAVSMVDHWLSEDEDHYQTYAFLLLRAEIRQARGNDDGALEDAENAVRLAREAKDPQVVYPTIGAAAFVFAVGEKLSVASTLADEFITGVRGDASRLSSGLSDAFRVAWVLTAEGREAELLAVLEDATSSHFANVAQAIASGDFRAAADELAAMGLKPDESYARLRAAEKLAAAGQRAEADRELRAALAFYRSVGAVRFVREGEALLAASA